MFIDVSKLHRNRGLTEFLALELLNVQSGLDTKEQLQNTWYILYSMYTSNIYAYYTLHVLHRYSDPYPYSILYILCIRYYIYTVRILISCPLPEDIPHAFQGARLRFDHVFIGIVYTLLYFFYSVLWLLFSSSFSPISSSYN